MALFEMSDFWLLRLVLILCGYASVLLPGYLLVRLVRRKWTSEKAASIIVIQHCCLQMMHSTFAKTVFFKQFAFLLSDNQNTHLD